MDPALAEPDPPMARPVDEIVPKHSLDVTKDLGVTCRVQAMAAVVHRLTGQLKAAGVSSNGVAPLDHRHLDAAAPRESIGATEAGGASAQDDDAGNALDSYDERNEPLGACAVRLVAGEPVGEKCLFHARALQDHRTQKRGTEDQPRVESEFQTSE